MINFCGRAATILSMGLRKLINNWPSEVSHLEPNLIDWHLCLDGKFEEYTEQQILLIASQLRKAANSEKIEYIGLSQGSVKLKFRSTQEIFDTLKALYQEDKLQENVNGKVLDLQIDLGAVLRITSRIVDDEYQSTTRYLPEIFGERSLEAGFPPVVGGISFPLDDPMQLGFNLLADPNLGMPTSEEQSELLSRLGHYLNALLVLSGDQVNVTLRPTDSYCGLPKLLRYTELGRDLLAQDILLKHFTASQLHPSTIHGKAFWNKIDSLVTDSQAFETCFRVWILPDSANIRTETENGLGCVKIEQSNLKVLCGIDYDMLHKIQKRWDKRPIFDDIPQYNQQTIDSFKELILPKVEQEVSSGSRFGLLRQIFSVLVIAKWIKESELGAALKQAGFVDSNNPEKYNLNTVSEDILHSMKHSYLQMFGDGIWQYTRTHINVESNVAEKRLYVAGGIELDLKQFSKK